MTHSRATLRRLLDTNSLAPRRDLGQNFVADPNTVRRIAALASIGPDDHVVEIGPDTGAVGKDFGDAPAPFPTGFAWDGARHLVQETPTILLGTIIDVEADGQPNATARCRKAY